MRSRALFPLLLPFRALRTKLNLSSFVFFLVSFSSLLSSLHGVFTSGLQVRSQDAGRIQSHAQLGADSRRGGEGQALVFSFGSNVGYTYCIQNFPICRRTSASGRIPIAVQLPQWAFSPFLFGINSRSVHSFRNLFHSPELTTCKRWREEKRSILPSCNR